MLSVEASESGLHENIIVANSISKVKGAYMTGVPFVLQVLLAWLPGFLYCPVCTAVTPTTVNGASQLHNSESVSVQ